MCKHELCTAPPIPLAASSLNRYGPANSSWTGSMLKAAMRPSVAPVLYRWNSRAIFSCFSFNVGAVSATAEDFVVRGFLGARGASLAPLVISLILFESPPPREPPLRRDIFDVGARAPFANEVSAEWSRASFLRARVAQELATGDRSGAEQ